MEKPAAEPVLTISELNRQVRLHLEGGFAALWVTGEISNLSRPASGHVYFSLKDSQAQVRCAMFRSTASRIRFRPENGQQVLVRCRITLYESRGDYQLLVEHLEPAGDGLLLRRFEELKKKLAAEGLFEADRKKPLPVLPRRIGVITSPTGAAVRDILKILRRRFPSIPVLIYPVQVQGEAAKTDIARALRLADSRGDCDVLILARGGGSLEDLWAFNEEIVARAIDACRLPVVTGVGHEIDFTIADLVADVRAPTPSGAAELVAPDWQAWAGRVRNLQRHAAICICRCLEKMRAQFTQLDRRLNRTHPGFVLRQHNQRLDEMRARLVAASRRQLQTRRTHIRHLVTRLRSMMPKALVERLHQDIVRQRLRLASATRIRLAADSSRLAVAAAALHAFSPLKTLERGYAIVRDPQTGRVIRRAKDLREGQIVSGTLAEGSFEAAVQKIIE